MSQQQVKDLIGQSIKIYLSFTPSKNEGLLFWKGSLDSNYISAGMKDGFFIYVVQFDNDRRLTVTSRNRLDLDTEHKTTFTLNSRSGELVVGNEAPIRRQLTTSNDFDVSDDYLFVGGHPSNIADLTNGQYLDGFHGCLSKIGIMHKAKVGASTETWGKAYMPLSDDRWFSERVNTQCVKMC